ncbi:DEAD/DEAH box helicase [Sediminicoccus sp. BL-A-41-H5]|uniref:DEAD/DEAH box helicase n=1 Tax=Sediminicoccus sp. BL-A-41-H5 TaxID=3421106 RepID=UPI003D667C90
MAFRPIVRNSLKYPSPEALFNDCKKRKYPGLLSHQADVLRAYQKDALDKPDVAFQLPTGSGKTLVGVLLAEWRRRTFQERTLFLVPTRQLAFQVANEAREKYDIRVFPLIGKKNQFPPDQQSAWEASDAVVVTTYQGLFNVNPAFRDPQVIIVDDAHAAENNFASYWSLSVKKIDHPNLWKGLVSLLSGNLRKIDQKRMLESSRYIDDAAWIEKLPTPALHSIADGLTELLDENLLERSDAWYSWNVLRSHILACHLYLSSNEILLRPLVVPSSSHTPFNSAKQRIYMSATLGQGGDLERLTGRRAIHRIPVPETWATQGLGRRLFLFPSKSLAEQKDIELLPTLIKAVPRCTVLAPTTVRATYLGDLIRNSCSHEIFTAEQIEKSKSSFVETNNATAVLANRYDGIDFPGDECRLLVVDGMPRAINLQEKFIMARMGAAILLNDRMMTRVVQAFGRCTRAATDFSCVVVLGDEVLNLLQKREKRALLHPELQAEVEFGLEQSSGATAADYRDYLKAFLEQDTSPEWQENGEPAIQGLREDATQRRADGDAELAAGVAAEVDFQNRMWNADYEGAVEAARRVLANLKGDPLSGYRGLWSYLAGSAAYLATVVDGRQLDQVAKDFFWGAGKETRGISWLTALGRYSDRKADVAEGGQADAQLVERLEAVIEEVGSTTDTKLVRIEKEIREGINGTSSEKFEAAHEKLGRLLGYDAGNKETSGAPDPWWIVDENLCFIFEDHSEGKGGALDVTKARQVASHPAWARANLQLAPDAMIIPVLISGAQSADTDAVPHLEGVSVWPLDDFRAWSERALAAFRHIRNIYPGNPGDLAWRAEARAALARENVDLDSILKKMKENSAAKILGFRRS